MCGREQERGASRQEGEEGAGKGASRLGSEEGGTLGELELEIS